MATIDRADSEFLPVYISTQANVVEKQQDFPSSEDVVSSYKPPNRVTRSRSTALFGIQTEAGWDVHGEKSSTDDDVDLDDSSESDRRELVPKDDYVILHTPAVESEETVEDLEEMSGLCQEEEVLGQNESVEVSDEHNPIIDYSMQDQEPEVVQPFHSLSLKPEYASMVIPAPPVWTGGKVNTIQKLASLVPEPPVWRLLGFFSAKRAQ